MRLSRVMLDWRRRAYVRRGWRLDAPDQIGDAKGPVLACDVLHCGACPPRIRLSRHQEPRLRGSCCWTRGYVCGSESASELARECRPCGRSACAEYVRAVGYVRTAAVRPIGEPDYRDGSHQHNGLI